jgi:hypothetical protein
MLIRIYHEKSLAPQGLPWALVYSNGQGYQTHTASALEVCVPSWSEVDYTSKQARYFWACRGQIHWDGTKAIITRESNENDKEDQSKKDHQDDKAVA